MEKFFLTTEIVNSAMADFDWPEEFILEEEGPGLIIIEFPRCMIILKEDPYYGQISSVEITYDGADQNYDIHDVLPFMHLFNSDKNGLNNLNLTDTFGKPHTVEKITAELKDSLTILHKFLGAVILGDFSWLPSFEELEKNKQLIQQALWNNSESHSANIERIIRHPIYIKLTNHDPSWKIDLDALHYWVLSAIIF